jgi:adenosine/AMP kinase
VRYAGNDKELKKLAAQYAFELACACINVLERIKQVPEVCGIYVATANPLEVIVAETSQGRAVLGVVDGMKSKGIETEKDIQARKAFLRKIEYKL